MQKFLFSALLLLLQLCLAAQTDRQAIQYQAIARDKNQQPLGGVNVSVEAKIYRNGTAVYSEKSDKKTAATGLFALEIGRGNAVDFQKIDWSSGDFELEISVSGGVNLTSRAPILSVPFAFRAANLEPNGAAAGQVLKWDATGKKWLPAKDETGPGGGGATALEDLSDVNLAGVSVGQVLKWDGSKWAPQNDIGGGTGDNWGSQTVQRTAIFSGNGTAASPLDLAAQGAATGQVLKWDGSKWVPQNDIGGGSGDGWGSDFVRTDATISGNGTAGNLLKIAQQNASAGQVLKWSGSAWSPSDDLMGGGSGFWTANGTGIGYSGGDVGIKTAASPNDLVLLGGFDINTGQIGGFQTLDDKDRVLVEISGDYELGYGGIFTLKPNGQNLVSIFNDNDGDGGAVIIYGKNDKPIARTIITTEGNGSIETRGPLDKETCNMNALKGYPNHGYISVSDESEVPAAGMFVNQFKQGIVFGDSIIGGVKNFRMPDPRDLEKEIWYASVEGPEAAAYERGTAKLTNGRVFVPFSDHFSIVINPDKLTVQLTPLFSKTFGLAVVEKTPTGFWVEELQGGTGNFEFDWEAKSVRKGYENYQVSRPKFDPRPAKSLPTPAPKIKGH